MTTSVERSPLFNSAAIVGAGGRQGRRARRHKRTVRNKLQLTMVIICATSHRAGCVQNKVWREMYGITPSIHPNHSTIPTPTTHAPADLTYTPSYPPSLYLSLSFFLSLILRMRMFCQDEDEIVLAHHPSQCPEQPFPFVRRACSNPCQSMFPLPPACSNGSGETKAPGTTSIRCPDQPLLFALCFCCSDRHFMYVCMLS